MNRSKQEYISPIEIGILISSSILGVVVLTLPRLATQAAKYSGIISVFSAGVISMILTIAAAYLGKKFYNMTIMEYSLYILGKIPGKLFGLLLVSYFTIITSIALRVFSDTLKLFMLPKTPIEFIMITMIIVVVYAAYNGIGTITKVSEAFIPLVVIALALVILLNFQTFKIRNLYPLISNNIISTFIESFKGIPKILTAFLGFEIIFFAIPFMQKPEKSIPYAAVGVVLPTIIYTALVAVCIGVFGIDLTQKMLFPAISLARAIDFPGGFAERFDIFFGILWILGAFTSISIFFYMSSLGTIQLLGLRNFRPIIFMLVPIIYAIAIFPENIYSTNQLLDIVGYIGIAIVLSPVALLLISKFTGRGEKKNAEKK